MALGLGYWKMMGLIILPQALKVVIPGIVNTFIGLFKDTTLVMIVAIFDFLGQLRAAFADPNWSTPVTLFTGFPTVTIIWTVFAIAYQQFENYVVQPRIQSRAVALDPFIVVVAAIFGGTLFGVVGALLAIPSAAALLIGLREYLSYRRAIEQGQAPSA